MQKLAHAHAHISSFIYTHFIIYLYWHAEAHFHHLFIHISSFIYAKTDTAEAHISAFIYAQEKKKKRKTGPQKKHTFHHLFIQKKTGTV